MLHSPVTSNGDILHFIFFFTDGLGDNYTLGQTAVRAPHSCFVPPDLLGFDNVSVYDGSWTEWSNKEDTPIDP